jgi:hypothetical protein
VVFHELRTNPSVAKHFDAVDFLAGAKGAYPVVHDLMLNMDPEEGDIVPLGSGSGGGKGGHAGSKKDNNRRLRGMLGPKLFEAAKMSMGMAKGAGQSWTVEELVVEKAWLQDILVDDPASKGAGHDGVNGGVNGGGGCAI